MGAGDKGQEISSQGGSTFVQLGWFNAISPEQAPHLPAPLLCAAATSCLTPPTQGDRTPCATASSLPPQGNPQSLCLFRRLQRGSSCRWWRPWPALSDGGKWGLGFLPVSCFSCGLLVLENLFCGAVDEPCVAHKLAAG